MDKAYLSLVAYWKEAAHGPSSSWLSLSALISTLLQVCLFPVAKCYTEVQGKKAMTQQWYLCEHCPFNKTQMHTMKHTFEDWRGVIHLQNLSIEWFPKSTRQAWSCWLGQLLPIFQFFNQWKASQISDWLSIHFHQRFSTRIELAS